MNVRNFFSITMLVVLVLGSQIFSTPKTANAQEQESPWDKIELVDKGSNEASYTITEMLAWTRAARRPEGIPGGWVSRRAKQMGIISGQEGLDSLWIDSPDGILYARVVVGQSVVEPHNTNEIANRVIETYDGGETWTTVLEFPSPSYYSFAYNQYQISGDELESWPELKDLAPNDIVVFLIEDIDEECWVNYAPSSVFSRVKGGWRVWAPWSSEEYFIPIN